jgi:hypothetical protein
LLSWQKYKKWDKMSNESEGIMLQSMRFKRIERFFNDRSSLISASDDLGI